tara:strand:- start:887 stop:1321 length:435 start_codon:yes stop_codon:yes gene_type:complete
MYYSHRKKDHFALLLAEPLLAVSLSHDFFGLPRVRDRKQHSVDPYIDGNEREHNVTRHSVPSDTADLCTQLCVSTTASCHHSVASQGKFRSHADTWMHGAKAIDAVVADVEPADAGPHDMDVLLKHRVAFQRSPGTFLPARQPL